MNVCIDQEFARALLARSDMSEHAFKCCGFPDSAKRFGQGIVRTAICGCDSLRIPIRDQMLEDRSIQKGQITRNHEPCGFGMLSQRCGDPRERADARLCV